MAQLQQKITELFTSKTSKKSWNFQALLVVIILVLLNIAGSTLHFRFDLTSNGSYSLTERSKEVVSTLTEKMRVVVLFSENLPPDHARIGKYTKDLLAEYESAGNKNFSYEVVSQSDLKKQASLYGIRPVTSRELKNDQVSLRNAYMGVVILHADLMESIDAVATTSGLEYEITSRMEKMKLKVDALNEMREKKKSINVVLYMDNDIKKLPIEGIKQVESIVGAAVAKENERNYGRLSFKKQDVAGADDPAIPQYGLNMLKWREPGKKGEKTSAWGVVIQWKDHHITLPLHVVNTMVGTNAIAGLDVVNDLINDAVSTLFQPNKKVAYLTGHQEADLSQERNPNGGTVLKQILAEGYNLEVIDLKKKDIGPDVNLLVINGPALPLSEYELYKIDQFIMKGNSVLVFMDSFKEFRMPRGQNMFGQKPMVMPVHTGLGKLLKHYGITVNKDLILDRECARVNMGNSIKDYYSAVKITRKNLSDTSQITRKLQGLALLKGSSITWDEKKLKEQGVTVKPLVKSSRRSWLMKGRVNFNPMFMSPPADESKYGQYTMALLAEGTFHSFYAAGEVPEKPLDEKDGTKGRVRPLVKKNSLTSETRLASVRKGTTGRLLVVSTGEAGRSQFIINARDIMSGGKEQGANFPNSLFIHNMVDYLTGNIYVPDMRGKSIGYHPLDKSTPASRMIIKGINMAVVPFVVILWGLFMWQARKRYRKKIEETFGRKEEAESNE